MYYVYELVNLLGTVEYVGQTKNPKDRFYRHTKRKPGLRTGSGKFYKRQDISMHIVATYATEEEALKAEFDLQVFWGLPIDGSTRSHNVTGSKNGHAKLNEDQVRQIKSLLAQKISCGEIGRNFGISHIWISKIKSDKIWKHVK
jgi:predicted GIY-YIG superfamily endonuclease